MDEIIWWVNSRPTCKWKLYWRKNHSASGSWIDEKIIVILTRCEGFVFTYLLYWAGIRGNAFRASYAVLADRQQQQINKPILSRKTIKPKASRENWG